MEIDELETRGIGRRILKPWQIRMFDLPAAHQHLSILSAALEGRDNFAGVEQCVGIKGVFDRKHVGVFFSRELHAHAVEFFHTYAVLARHGSAHGDTGL